VVDAAELDPRPSSRVFGRVSRGDQVAGVLLQVELHLFSQPILEASAVEKCPKHRSPAAHHVTPRGGCPGVPCPSLPRAGSSPRFPRAGASCLAWSACKTSRGGCSRSRPTPRR